MRCRNQEYIRAKAAQEASTEWEIKAIYLARRLALIKCIRHLLKRKEQEFYGKHLFKYERIYVARKIKAFEVLEEHFLIQYEFQIESINNSNPFIE